VHAVTYFGSGHADALNFAPLPKVSLRRNKLAQLAPACCGSGRADALNFAA
jgi:hypothetical protein